MEMDCVAMENVEELWDSAERRENVYTLGGLEKLRDFG